MKRMIAALLLSLAALPAQAEMDDRSGAWTVRAELPEGGGGFVTALALPPAASAASGDPSYLIMRCLSGRAEFLVGTNGGWGIPRQRLDVVTQAGDAPPTTSQWDVSTNGKAVFLSEGVEAFVRSLPDPGRLKIVVTDNNGGAHENVFDISGVGRVRDMLAQACRWPK